MRNIYKYIFYVASCAIVFLFLVKMYGGLLPARPADAFEWEKTVKVYFMDLKKTETLSCEADVALDRIVPNAETLGPGALGALLEGLTENEKLRYSTSINTGTLLQKFEIRDRVAFVDFNSNLNNGVTGSCAVTAIRSQIEKTLINLPDIDSVVISVDDKTEGILEP